MTARIHLIGGGWQSAEVYAPFLGDAGPAARIGCVLVDEGNADEQFVRCAERLTQVGPCVPVALTVPLGGRFDPAALDDVDALLVCGGLTPAYQEALVCCADAVRRTLTERAMPYAGFSAGAAVAAATAVVGGWLDAGVPVCPDDIAEDLDEVAARDGLGLVPFSVDVHAAQWGTLPRLISAVGSGRAPFGVALDEDALVTCTAGEPVRVSGAGRAHMVRRGRDGGVEVRSWAAGQSFRVGQPG
ncbi:hypothetical protein I3F58_12195 [Streptomyces sp. MUM 203J]|uniref:hypothetical protein n=1 Tax=Streptomyces sp. MUM 203J TaxID=2791990 RepID=UPI001F043D1A|nr:hypothetical protein [Streptomyces sp. MUM 203J]MCH0540317.1 hypothetical protein [Streptomyces sp. MUM 203J]